MLTLNCPSDTEMTLHFEIQLEADKRIFNVIRNNSAGESRFDCQKKIIEVEHTWTIDNFTDLFVEGTVMPYFIQSGHFPAHEEQTERFCLRLCPNGWSHKSKDYVELFVWNDNEDKATVHYEMSILDVDDDKCLTRAVSEKIPLKYGRHFGYHRTFLLKNLKGLLHNNKLRVHCKINYMMDLSEDYESVDGTQIPAYKSESTFDVAKKATHYGEQKYDNLCLNSQKDVPINLQEFELPTDTRVRLQLSLWPNGHDEQSNRYLSVDLHNVSDHFDSVTAQYRISIVDANGHKWNRWGDQSTISCNGKVRRSKFFLQSQFHNPSLISHYLPDGKLTIVCEIWVVQDRKIQDDIDKPSEQIHNISGPNQTIHVYDNHASYIQVNSKSNIGGPVGLTSNRNQ